MLPLSLLIPTNTYGNDFANHYGNVLLCINVKFKFYTLYSRQKCGPLLYSGAPSHCTNFTAVYYMYSQQLRLSNVIITDHTIIGNWQTPILKKAKLTLNIRDIIHNNETIILWVKYIQYLQNIVLFRSIFSVCFIIWETLLCKIS